MLGGSGLALKWDLLHLLELGERLVLLLLTRLRGGRHIGRGCWLELLLLRLLVLLLLLLVELLLLPLDLLVQVERGQPALNLLHLARGPFRIIILV
ncbi:MAG: hypothetical protein ACMG6E_05900, partial [Candidatus Roizmanbacteria bacterium]